MSIEQNIIDAVEISKVTRIPVLFMSNPGLGKTTILTRYAEHNKMHLETLIGSRFTPEEISGYQVNPNNGSDHLVHLSPEWFSRIKENADQGRKTLLFIDELSTCSEFVQGALLSLIFDRTIGSGKYLPQDCLIVAAANYSGNLPSTMNLMAPTLNRFIIINLNHNYNALDMMQEFLNPPKPVKYPGLAKKVLPDFKTNFMNRYQNIWKEIFLKYSDPKGHLGLLDISNQKLDGLYSESTDCIYNFISGRTISYLSRALMAYTCLDISNSDILKKIIDGLVGAGTCLFVEEQGNAFRKKLYDEFEKLIASGKRPLLCESKTFLPMVHDISKDISSFLVNVENTSFSQADLVSQSMDIGNQVRTEFELNNILVLCGTEAGRAKIISDLDAVSELSNYVIRRKIFYSLQKIVTGVCVDYYGLYCQIMNIIPDYQQHFGIADSALVRICFGRIKYKGSYNYAKAAVRKIRYSNGLSAYSLYLLDFNEIYGSSPLQENKRIQNNSFEVLNWNGEKVEFLPVKKYMSIEAGIQGRRISA